MCVSIVFQHHSINTLPPQDPSSHNGLKLSFLVSPISGGTGVAGGARAKWYSAGANSGVYINSSSSSSGSSGSSDSSGSVISISGGGIEEGELEDEDNGFYEDDADMIRAVFGDSRPNRKVEDEDEDEDEEEDEEEDEDEDEDEDDGHSDSMDISTFKEVVSDKANCNKGMNSASDGDSDSDSDSDGGYGDGPNYIAENMQRVWQYEKLSTSSDDYEQELEDMSKKELEQLCRNAKLPVR
jgi:hypothetical protein